MRTPLFLGSVLLLALGLHTRAQPAKITEPDPDLVYAERVLMEANVAIDGPALIAFFKARTLTQAEQDRLAAAINNLGDDSFEVREKASSDLVSAGRLALTFLSKALSSKDVEVVSRAQRCKQEIELRPESSLVPAAALMIALKRPDGATEALLNCLPWLDDESLHEELFKALARLGLKKDGRAAPELTAASKDRDPTRRAAAAFVLGRGDEAARRAVTPLLADADARVRFHAAASLLRAGDKAAVAPLCVLLTDSPAAVAWQSEDLLCRLAGEKAPAVSVGPGTEVERRKARAAWETWWSANREKVDLAKVSLDESFQSGIIIAELEGRVWEAGPDGMARWSFNSANRPIDARLLPGGRVLVAEHGANRVTERDRKGTVLWEHKVTNQPVVCQRLPNGNTFIATYQDLLEVTPAGKTLYSHKTLNGMIYHAEKMRDGHFVYVTSGNMVIELDADGKVLRQINTIAAGNTSGWSSVERLTNGNYLVAFYSNNLVAELDPAGKVIWRMTPEKPGQNPGHAMRLRNGNILVANIEGRTVVEYDRAGKEVWSVKSPGRPFHAWRR